MLKVFNCTLEEAARLLSLLVCRHFTQGKKIRAFAFVGGESFFGFSKYSHGVLAKWIHLPPSLAGGRRLELHFSPTTREIIQRGDLETEVQKQLFSSMCTATAPPLQNVDVSLTFIYTFYRLFFPSRLTVMTSSISRSTRQRCASMFCYLPLAY